jgi:hypothetical protein
VALLWHLEGLRDASPSPCRHALLLLVAAPARADVTSFIGAD